MAVTIHLVRHGCTDAIGHCLAGRAAGWALNATGEAEVARLAENLASVPCAAVVAGPLLRVQQTAAAIAGRRGVAVTTDPGLDEIDFGEWTGRSFSELHGDPLWVAWNSHRALARIPGGETMAAAQARTLAALAALRDAWPEQHVVAVSHADVIKSALLGVLGAPLELMHRLAIDPASRSIVRLHEGTAEILAVNLPPGG